MARIEFDFFSHALGVGVSTSIIYPDPEVPPEDAPSVLYLLHGLSDDHTAWSRYTSIERYARRYNLAVVMPAVGRSFYRDMSYGPAYWHFVSDELPRILDRTFHIATDRDRTFVAGLSMGGYGAMRLALSRPERFRAAATFSGVVDMMGEFAGKSAPDPEDPIARDIFLVYGDDRALAGGQEDLFALVTRLAQEKASIPTLYVACGTEDFLFDHNERFHEHLDSLGVRHRYRTEPGTHEWGFWDRHVDAFLKSLEEDRLLMPLDVD